jgi:hypothetical protein
MEQKDSTDAVIMSTAAGTNREKGSGGDERWKRKRRRW